MGEYTMKAAEKIRQLEEKLYKLESIANNIVGGVEICEYNKYYPITYVSDGFLRLTGYDREEIAKDLHNSHKNLIVPQDLPQVSEEIEKQLLECQKFTLEYRIRRKDGKIIWVLDRGVVVPSKEGQPMIQSILTDITEHKELEEALRISEERYEIAMSFSDLTIFNYNVLTNQMIHHWTDVEAYHLPKVMDNAVETFISSGIVQPCSIEDFRELYRKIHSGAPSARAVIHATDGTGNNNVVELILTNIFDDNGRPVRAVGVRKDITQKMLLQREKEYGNTLVSNKIYIYEANIATNRVLDHNRQWAEEFGLSNIAQFSELVRAMSEETVAPEHRRMFVAKMSKAAIVSEFERAQRLISFEYRSKIDEHDYGWVEKTINIIKEELSGDINIRCYVQNINERKEKEIRAMAEQRYYEAMISKSSTIYEINITKDLVLMGHERWPELFGITAPERYSQMMYILYEKIVAPEDRDDFYRTFHRQNLLQSFQRGREELACEYRRPAKSGDMVWVRCAMHLFQDPQTDDIKAFSYVEEIQEEKQKELSLIYKSQYDVLTAVYNKSTTEEQVEQFLASAQGQGGNHAFFIVDLDRFKNVNDSCGHCVGDQVLTQMGSKLKGLFRSDDILGRVGGDEFVVLMKYIKSIEAVFAKAQEICDMVLEAKNRDGSDHKITASIGIAMYNQHGKSYGQLYQNSDTALYESKRMGRDRFTVYREFPAEYEKK